MRSISYSLPRRRGLRRLLITDTAPTVSRVADIVVWVGHGEAPPARAKGQYVIAPSSLRAAASYVAGAPSEFQLALSDPLAFMALLAEVRDAPALRAA